ncbi:MAG: NAD(P)/FAD-dependent oxidoreductase [Candidatus Nanohaloarchaea archaeon]
MDERYVIIGDGIAGATAAETIREEEEDAEIRVFTDESEPLYNRIMLKSYMKGDLPGLKFTRVHDENWYDKRDIELHLETRVSNVDTGEKEVETDSGKNFSYDKLLIATGGSPRKLPQDEGYENLHYMWTIGDAESIKESAEEADEAVVIGGGLLGIDLAVAFAENGCDTHYLIREDNWWHRGLNREGAEIIHRKLEEKGCKVITNSEVKEIRSEDGKVEEVVTNSGRSFECDAVAVAIGQVPNSEIVDVEKNDHEMIKTDEYLQTSDPDIYAAGNMVEYYSPVFQRRIVNGSWDHSEAMGEKAAMNMLGEQQVFDFVNTYGVGHFDVQFLAMGDWKGEAENEDLEKEDYYRRKFYRDGKLVGAVMIGDTSGQEEVKGRIKE